MTQPTAIDARITLPPQQQEPPELTSVAEKTLPSKCKDGSLLTYCPTMDLIALATEDEQLHVFRLNGQEVLSADLAGDPYLDEVKGEIRGVRWKNDGITLLNFQVIFDDIMKD
jgi:anaphase-promoting complex subunit 4